ncbi:hypothetical protein HanPI659440_Chr07g0260091 [Helianthus annuus]|nr:hypothetical protein HanPI659440_Chr07g0260091 [Helianthus annuus]
MARQTRSSSGDSAPTFTPQNLLQYPEKEWCTFDSGYLSSLQTSGIFLDGTIFRSYDRELRSVMSSTKWLCFNVFLFTLGLQFPFSDFSPISSTSPALASVKPCLCSGRVLVVLDQIKNTHIPKLSVNDLPIAYRLRSHGSSRFLFYSTSHDPLILRATRNEEEWKSKFFFFFCKKKFNPWWSGLSADFRKLAPPLADSEKRIKAIYRLPDPERSFVPFSASSSQHSSSNMSDTSKMPILIDLDELDSYPTPVQVKKETPATTSSKPTAAPKPNPKTRASTSKKRKGSDTATPASEGFSYEDLISPTPWSP